MPTDPIPSQMRHFRLRLPGALVAAIITEAERQSRATGHRVTVSAVARAALVERFAHLHRTPSAK